MGLCLYNVGLSVTLSVCPAVWVSECQLGRVSVGLSLLYVLLGMWACIPVWVLMGTGLI